jgi:hypothetical protein
MDKLGDGWNECCRDTLGFSASEIKTLDATFRDWEETRDHNLRDVCDGLFAIAQDCGKPKQKRALIAHHRALLKMQSIEGSGPDFEAAMEAESAAVKRVVKTRCGSHAFFIHKLKYLTLYISILDPGVEEIHAVTDAVYEYLLEIKA